MNIRTNTLIKLNGKGKVQVVDLNLNQISENNFIISRSTYQFGGKIVSQPELNITDGKSTRTAAEQAALQYNSLLKNYLDKGYKKLTDYTTKNIDELNSENIVNFLGKFGSTDSNGVPKPMLAKSSEDLSPGIFENEWYISRKYNGVRCLIYYKDGIIRTSSRGGKTYDKSMTHIINNSHLQEFFKSNPNVILDGELYHHGWALQKISGLCRLETPIDECKEISYNIYDFISDKVFKDRLEDLKDWSNLFDNNDPIIFVEHILLSGWLKIKSRHDAFVKEGYEGLCMRNPNKEYGIGKRSGIYLVKLKSYSDMECEVVGAEKGLRPEDMVFIMKLNNGRTFKAKPVGTAEERINYLTNIQDYIGKFATIKYFEYSSDGIPCQPILVHFRPEDE